MLVNTDISRQLDYDHSYAKAFVTIEAVQVAIENLSFNWLTWSLLLKAANNYGCKNATPMHHCVASTILNANNLFHLNSEYLK